MNKKESLELLQSVYEDIKNMDEEDIARFNDTVAKYQKEHGLSGKELCNHDEE